ncbi:hypothetical protein GCM10017687_85060 [Streptomyces echinatus]
MFWTGALPALLVVWLRRRVHDAPTAAAAREQDPRRGSFAAIFRPARDGAPGLLRTTVFASLLSTGVQGGYYTLATWVPTYLKSERGLSVVGTGGYLTFLISGAFLGYLTGGQLTDRLGRRAQHLAVRAAVGAVRPDVRAHPAGRRHPAAGARFPARLLHVGHLQRFGSYLSELYPTAVRGTGQGFTYNTGRAVGAVFPTLGGFPGGQLGRRRARWSSGAIGYGLAALAPARTAGDAREGAGVTGVNRSGDRPVLTVDAHRARVEPESRAGPFPRGAWPDPPPGVAAGHTQANLIAVPADWAYDMLLFCQRNPKPCPVLDVTDAGSPRTVLAEGADLRDRPAALPGVWQDGELVDEPTDARAYWRDAPGVVPARLQLHLRVGAGPGGRADPACRAGPERADVRDRPGLPGGGPAARADGRVHASGAARASGCRDPGEQSLLPAVHGGPVHCGDPAALGIEDLDRPDFGDPVALADGDIPVFWACGVILRRRP